jgi:hypothetical protein
VTNTLGQIFDVFVSQQHVSHLQKDSSICIKHFFVFTTTANLFAAEIQQVSNT